MQNGIVSAKNEVLGNPERPADILKSRSFCLSTTNRSSIAVHNHTQTSKHQLISLFMLSDLS